MTPEISTALLQAYGPPGLLVVYLIVEWWRNRSAKQDPTKALFDKLDRIETDVSALRNEVKQMDQRDDAIHDRVLKLETREEMRGK